MVLKDHPRGIIETVFCNAIVTAHEIDINKYIIKEEIETPKPEEKPEQKENETVEDPEEELIEDDIDDDDVDDPDDEVNENDVPNEWRRILYVDRQNMERLCDFDLSDG